MSRFVRRSRFAIIFAASVIASPEFAQENAQEKSHDLTSFFSGNLIATGQFSDYLGRSTRGLQVEIHGAPDGGVFKLVEDATYSDGEKKKWVWRFSKDSEGRYVGRRADLIGEAKVEAHGDKIEITYRAHVPMKDGNIQDLNFAETFIFTQAGTADYQLRVSLLFVPVAEAHLTVRKLGCCTDNGDKRPWQTEPQPSALR